MKGEELFRAVGQVGDDLIARAEKTPARQASRWRPLAALAACCVLLVGIAALTLPGWLGSSKTASTAAPAAAAEESASARAYSEDILVESAAPEAEFEEYAAAQEAPAMEAPAADAPAADAPAEDATGSSAKAQVAEAGAPDGDWIVFGGQYYILAPANDPAHPASEGGDGEARGAQLGTVDDSSDDTLIGCAVYAYPDEDCVLVECEGDYILYRTAE